MAGAAIDQRPTFFGWVYLALLIWNGATTWWVCNSTLAGGIAAVLANALLMCIPWIGFYHVRRRMGPVFGYAALILFWLTFEYIHLNWELSWPWLTLGNVFATHPGWVQWYEYSLAPAEAVFGYSSSTSCSFCFCVNDFLRSRSRRLRTPYSSQFLQIRRSPNPALHLNRG